MASEPDRGPLERARAAAQQEEPAGWIQLSESIMARVRTIVTPSEPILVFADDGSAYHDAAGSHTRVSARVVVAALRRTLVRSTHAPADLDLTIVDERLAGVTVELVCAYGVDLVMLADTVRQHVLDQVTVILGPNPDFTQADIEIRIVDVVPGDPRVV